MSSRSFRDVLIVGTVAVAFAAGCGTGRNPVTRPPASPLRAPSATVRRTTPPSPACTTAGVLAHWSVNRLAEQTVVIPVDEDDVGSAAPEVAAGAGGVILFGTQAPSGLTSSLAQLVRNAAGGVPPFVMTDEEGGAVQRMANLAGSIPSAREMAATMTAA